MNWLDFRTEDCSVQRSLDVIGERWTLLIIRDAINGVRRFQDFHRHVGLSRPLLADRLRKLVAAGILETRPYREEGQRERDEYVLTRKGWDLQPAMVALMQWGDAYLADAPGPPIRLLHRECGHEVHAAVRCSCHDRDLTPRDIRVEAR